MLRGVLYDTTAGLDKDFFLTLVAVVRCASSGASSSSAIEKIDAPSAGGSPAIGPISDVVEASRWLRLGAGAKDLHSIYLGHRGKTCDIIILRGELRVVLCHGVCHERTLYIGVCNCSKDEGRPLGTGLQEQVSNHLKLLW